MDRWSTGSVRANQAVLVTAARLRILLDLKGLVWAAARDGERSAAIICRPLLGGVILVRKEGR